MLSGVCRRIFSSSRPSCPISRELARNFSCMKGSSKNSNPPSNPAISRDHRSGVLATESGQSEKVPELRIFLGAAKRKERPPVSDNTSFCWKSKRRTRIDLGVQSEQIINRRMVGMNSLQEEAASALTFESQQEDDFTLPIGKKRTPFSSGGQRNHKACSALGTGTENSSLAEASNASKPFDICFSDSSNPTILEPSPDDKDRGEQLLFDHSNEENGQVLRPGMVLFKNYIQLKEQVEIVNKCRVLGLGQGGFYQPSFKDGAKLRLHMMCLGKDWDPQTKRYGSIRQHDGSEPPDIPPSFGSLVSRALQDSYTLIRRDLETSNVEEILPGISPDICIINFYNTNGRLGLHQDRDESNESLLRGLPVVSISIGDSAEFLYGDERDVNKAESVILESGDVLIFGGKSRHVFHGVASIIPNTAPSHLITCTNLRPGRLNLTFREF